MIKKLQTLFLLLPLLLLAACYEAHVEVIYPDETVETGLVKDLVFEGYSRTEDGSFIKDTTYRIIRKEPPNDYIYVNDRASYIERRLRFRQLDENLFLMQVNVEDSTRYQLMLLQKNRGFFDVLMPERFNEQGIDVTASQVAMAQKLGIRLEGQGYGPFRLFGERNKIRIFMHSLSTLPTEVVYKFAREGQGF